jgi:hypothetical protein
MFGMKPPRENIPAITLTAAVFKDKTVYRKMLPIEAWNLPTAQIFTPENLHVIIHWPDSKISIQTR